MKTFALLFLLAISAKVYAINIDLDFAQSSPSLKWHSIENDVVRVIYPDSMKSESVYIANLVEHYSHVVGKTYGIEKPRLINIIIRPEMGQSNAYVTLAPRRSEWFSSSTYFPFVSSSEWFQTLAIHEYRHVNQFDHFNQKATRVLYYIMGETGWQLAAGLSLPSWYLEGDAVWAETKYTDAGRGRSPRFTSRLKALVLSNQIPTFDQFLSRTYKTELPNQYVYGYALVSYATQKFGDDFWSKVTDQVAAFPYPLSFYVSFKEVSDQSFEDFYVEAMNDLRTKWSKDKSSDENWAEYREYSTPFKSGDSLYYVSRNLDNHAQIIKEVNGQKEIVLELPFNKELQIIDIQNDQLVYTEFLPDERYGQKGSSDLFLVNLISKKSKKLTNDKRIYNPRFNSSGNKIIATEFKEDQSWNLTEFDLNGNVLNQFPLKDGKIAEAFYLNDESAVVLINNKTGNKLIATVNLKTHELKELLPPSRNLLHSLYVDKNKNILFEAQYKGATEIFKLSSENTLTQCTSSKLGAYTPSSDGENLYVSIEDVNGSLIKSSPLNKCRELAQKEIVAFNYLGDNASDAYNKFPIQDFAEQNTLDTKDAEKYQPKEYGDFDSKLFIPHSWGFTIGRGTGLGFKSDNYLRTLSFSGMIGTDPEESTSFTELNFDIKKFYPIFRLQLENRNREVKDYTTEAKKEWEEKAIGLAAIIPYVKKYGLYNFTSSMTFETSYLDTRDYKLNEVETPGPNPYFLKTGAGAGLSFSEDLKARSI